MAAVRGGSKVSKKKKSSGTKRKGKGSSSKRAPSAADVLQTLEELVDCFQYEEAVKCCEEGLQRDPCNATLLETLGSLLLEVDKADRAYEISDSMLCIPCLCLAYNVPPTEVPPLLQDVCSVTHMW